MKGCFLAVDLSDLHFGNFTVSHASGPDEIREAQALRYRVFFEEEANDPDNADKLDSDPYDEVCDHLLVYEHKEGGEKVLIGTYRLLREEGMHKIGRYYSQSEFNIDSLLAKPGQMMELGRSCVDPAYRSGAVIQLLWRGIAAYVEHYDIAYLFGCGSFHGSKAQDHATCLSYLHHFHLAPESYRPEPVTGHAATFELLDPDDINQRRAFAALPPLVKGYLRAGGKVGSGAYEDHACKTTDVCIVLSRAEVEDRYNTRFTRDGKTPDLPATKA